MAKPKTHIRKDDQNPENSVGGLRRTLCGLFVSREQLDNANPSCQKCLQFLKKAPLTRPGATNAGRGTFSLPAKPQSGLERF